jgi:hypothetical protein
MEHEKPVGHQQVKHGRQSRSPRKNRKRKRAEKL